MKSGFWRRGKVNRLSTIFLAVIAYIFFAFTDANQTFSHFSAFHTSILPVLLSFGFSLTVALISLAVGSLIWFYSYSRRLSFLLFIFSCTVMISFELETATSITIPNSGIFDALEAVVSSLAVFLFALILLVFPKNHLAVFSYEPTKRGFYRNWFRIQSSYIRWYIFLLTLLEIVTIFTSILQNIFSSSIPKFLDMIAPLSSIVALTGSLVTIGFSFRRSTPREREQLRFFMSGVVLALSPLLLLTAIPQTIAFLSPYVIDAQITTLTVILLPISLGYAILRYQILVFDTYIRRTVNSIMGTIFLAILIYVMYLLYTLLVGTTLLLFIITVIVIILSVVLAPATWWSAKQLTERVLFKESLRYRRLIDKPVTMGNEVLDAENIGQLITEAAMQTFKTTQVNLLVLAEDTGSYTIFPRLREGQDDEPRRILASRLASSLSTMTSPASTDELSLQKTVEKRLADTRRPLLLYEVTRAEEDMPTGLSRYLTSSSPDEQNDPLITPVRVQGRMIALLALGERADQQSYAGPDFEIVQLLITRYAALLETARMTEQLRAAYEHQKELDVLKDQFIMTASHELRTPLTAVLGYIELLEEYNGTLGADIRANFITKAHRGCDELVLMVNNIMDANRVQADVNNIIIASVSLEESVIHIVEIIESIVRREQRSISINVPSTLLVMADAIRLRQVLLNLVSNALKYSPQGTNIEISAEADMEYATVCVRDYGSGVPLGEQNRLFERFVRLERDMNSPTRGAGLGLFICRQLVEAMGGKIWVRSTGQAGEGSFFFFTLRLASAQIQATTHEQQNLSTLA